MRTATWNFKQACGHIARTKPNALIATSAAAARVAARALGRRSQKSALLFFDARRGALTCRVHDITNGGAGVELHAFDLLPLNFELTFDNFHNVRGCRAVWRQGGFVGVAFQN
jgi:hypothetical protein